MAAPDKKTVIRDLIELGKSKGQLTTKEILDAIGELDFDPEHIENSMIHWNRTALRLSMTSAISRLMTSTFPKYPAQIRTILMPAWAWKASPSMTRSKFT